MAKPANPASETRSRTLTVQTEPDKRQFIEGIIRDASIEACLFDLIDNSIDAAASKILGSTPHLVDEFGLPSSYAGFEVSLEVSPARVAIEDNCGGIPAKTLEEHVLRFGKHSRGRFHSIGYYGVGLNRAIFRLGNTAQIETDTGTERCLLLLDCAEYLKAKEWSLPAKAVASTGTRGTKIAIENIKPEFLRFLASRKWADDLRIQLSERYARFLQKGLTLKFGGVAVTPQVVQIRRDSHFPVVHKSYLTSNGVAIWMEAGQHPLHRFAVETGHDVRVTRRISQEFGWSVFCNDRAVLVANRETKTGWDAKWHPEFNGFVGVVHFVCADAGKLPWNTLKTDIERSNADYSGALDDMQSFVKQWRQYSNFVKKTRKSGGTLTRLGSKAAGTPTAASSVHSPSKKGETRERSASPEEHVSWLSTLMPKDIQEIHCRDKFLGLLREAKHLEIQVAPYASMALLRMLFEVAALRFLERRGNRGAAIDWCIAQAEKSMDKPFSKEARRKHIPAPTMIADYFTSDQTCLDFDQLRFKADAMRKFRKDIATINEVVHRVDYMLALSRVIEIRDNAIPILRYLIET